MVLLNGDDPNCVEVAKDCLAQMIEIGFSKNCAQRIRDVAYSSEGSRFKLGEQSFEINPPLGEFNVRMRRWLRWRRVFMMCRRKSTAHSGVLPVLRGGRSFVVKPGRDGD